jgi:hypothetical protein
MDTEHLLDRLSENAHTGLLVVFGVGLLIGGYAVYRLLDASQQTFQAHIESLLRAGSQSGAALNHYQALADLKTQDVNQFKAGMSNLAQSKKTLFEAGLSSQEERRLLEKQLEIMTTYMTINTQIARIFLWRGDQALESYLIDYVPLKAFGGISPAVPRVARVTSKERFAHPERGKSEVVNGKLQWQPPQVGTSVRSNALGEYVLFTNSRLILHGPPKNPEAHEAFPHLCLGLPLEAARNLYRHSFIGTKLVLTNVKEELERFPSFSVSVDTSAKPPHGN